MAIIYEDALKAQLKAKKILPVYIITGDDGYLKQLYVNKIINTVTDKDDVFNFQRFGAECNLQDVYDSLSQLPIMADRNVRFYATTILNIAPKKTLTDY